MPHRLPSPHLTKPFAARRLAHSPRTNKSVRGACAFAVLQMAACMCYCLAGSMQLNLNG